MRGFTLAELMMAIFLAIIVVGIGLRGAGRNSGRADAHAVSRLVAEEFRLARQRAISSQSPVAVGFPSQSGSTGLSQSLFILEGEQPRVTRVVDFSKEYAGAVIFNGYWALNGADLRRPGATNTIDPAHLAAKTGTVTMANWGVPAQRRRDYLYLFTPDGTLHTNDLVNFDDEYHLVVAAAASQAGAGPPGGSGVMAASPVYYLLDGVRQPFTVSLSPAGAVSIDTGVRSGQPVSSQLLNPGPIASAVGLPASSGGGPNILSVEILPSQVPTTVPPGVDSTIFVEGYATLRVLAVDSDGGPLYCSAQADGGSFSEAGKKRMDWLESDLVWQTHWTWRPPDSANDGDRFRFTCTVENANGQTTAVSAGAAPRLELIPEGRIYFSSNRTGDQEVFVMKWDGTSVRNLTESFGDQFQPSVSPRSRSLFYTTLGGVDKSYYTGVDVSHFESDAKEPFFGLDGYNIVFRGQDDIFISDRLGNNVDQLTSSVEPESHPTLSAGNDFVCFSRMVAGNQELIALEIATGAETVLASSPADEVHPVFDGNSSDPGVVFTSYRDGNAELYSVKVADPTVVTRLTNTPFNETEPTYSPNASQMAYVSDQDGNKEIYIADADGSNPRRVTNDPGDDDHPSWGY